MADPHEKYKELTKRLGEWGKTAVAFSGGTDSTFLLEAAHQALGDNVLAINVRSQFTTEDEGAFCSSFCKGRGIRLVTITQDILSSRLVSENPPDRCYHCKKILFEKIISLAAEHSIACITEGTNADDANDYRPGARALRELGIKTPLLDCGFTKEEIRLLSKEMGLPTWNKPSAACLASRVAYGETITEETLGRIQQAEKFLEKFGLEKIRVRTKGGDARIEVAESSFEKIISARREIHTELRRIGFSYITLDLGGYRLGSTNEVIEHD